MPAARVFPDSTGGVRVFLGSGDRDQIRVRDTDSVDGGSCTVDNLRACVRNGCTVDVKQNNFSLGSGGSAATFTGEWKYPGSSRGSSLDTTFTTRSTSSGGCAD